MEGVISRMAERVSDNIDIILEKKMYGNYVVNLI